MKALAFGVLALLSMWGCVRDGAQGLDGSALAPGTVRVGYTIDDMAEETRATSAESKERLLKDVHILFYDQDGNYITYQHAAVTAGTSSFTFPVPSVLVAGVQYKTLIVGNAHAHVPSDFESFDAYLEQSSTETYDQMRQQIFAERNLGHAGNEDREGLPMYGTFVDGDGHEIPFSFTEASGSVSLVKGGSANFSRSVSRLDLRNLAANSLIIDAVKLCNYRKAGYYFHNDAPLGDIQSGISDDTWVTVAPPDEANHQQLTAAVYAFANIVPVVQQNDDQTTYLMIRGYYQDGTDNTAENQRNVLSYYRFNMAENGRSQILRRNYRYVGVINSVKGPGASSEQGAHDAEAPMLGYEVDDTWTDNDSNTVTDNKGNYMTISRAMVTFDGYENLSEAVKVKVSDLKSITWSLEWDKTLFGEESDKFSYARVDDQQFSVTTLSDNATEFTRNARLIVKATGGTIDPDHPLTATVSVMQFSSLDETSTLMVDGQTGTITQTAPGAGATLSFQVETGSLKSGWIVNDSDQTAAAVGVTWTSKGANRGTLEINLPTNISKGERTFRFEVQRLASTGQVDAAVKSVYIEITQPKSDYLLTVSPMVPETGEGLVIEAFDPTPGTNPNGISKQQQFTVSLADPDNYTWTVHSTFAKDYDAFLTLTDAAAETTQAQWTDNTTVTNEITEALSGQAVWLNVFRTAPGDPKITGTLTFTAVPKTEDSGLATQTINLTVTLKTSCIINDALIPGVAGEYLLIADRNVGATKARIAQDGKFVTAGNFSNVVGMEITNKGAAENTFEEWRGGYYVWTAVVTETDKTSESFLLTDFFRDGQTLTNYDDEKTYSPWYTSDLENVKKWHVPTKNEYSGYIIPRVVYSKQRPFVVSDYKDLSGNYVGCLFPLAGYGSSVSPIVSGMYWTATSLSISNANALSFSTSGCSMLTSTGSAASNRKSNLLNVRCVRTTTAEEVTEAQKGNYIGAKW